MPSGKKTLFITGRTSIGCQKHKSKRFSVPEMFICLFVLFNIVIGHLGRPYSTHTAPMSVLTGSVHAHILTKPSRAGFALTRLELIEPDAATCVWRHAWDVFKKLGTYVPGTSTITFFFYSGKIADERGPSQQLYLQVGRPCP